MTSRGSLEISSIPTCCCCILEDSMDQQNMPSAVEVQLRNIMNPLVSYLNDVLPRLFNDWWTEGVWNNLTYSQQNRLRRSDAPSLADLDLAALLRVLDQNWYQLSNTQGFTTEDRHYVKEMMTVRNRWAHTDSQPRYPDDIFRDLDTIQRFGRLIGADECFDCAISEAKSEIYSSSADRKEKKPEGKRSFSPGEMVQVRSRPGEMGAVISVAPGQPEARVTVFLGNSLQQFYESQLQPCELQAEEEENISCSQFHSRLSALQISHPSLSTLYSLKSARVDFIPYQFRPVLRFIRAELPRLLIADGVGVGKTIEAGLILRELQARREVRSVLVICPRPLVTEKKWLREFKRFGEDFIQLDGRILRYCLDETDSEGMWPERYQKCIVPYSLLNDELLAGSGKKGSKKGLLKLDPPPSFDLVIVDEAHHVRNPDTQAHQVVRFFCDHAQAAVFLTATPIQTKSDDLFVLLNMLRPDLILDRESFASMTAPNPWINKAALAMRRHDESWQQTALEALDNACATSWGQSLLRYDPRMLDIKKKLSSADSVPREERVRMISDTEELHTLSGIINRTRRRDIGAFTVRRPRTVEIAFTEEQKFIHDELLRIRSDILGRLYRNVNIKFLMSTLQRQAASCIFGLADLIGHILSRGLDAVVLEGTDADIGENADISLIRQDIMALQAAARELSDHDPKLEGLCRLIEDKQLEPSNKIMIFSSFRHTLYYLERKLRDRGFRVGLIHGDVPDEERIALRNRFEGPRESETTLDIMLFSEVGCEGLDYQFCDYMVNYDLPWNPMRIEQRIGRIDRRGQKSESITIVNMITPGTIDAEIYSRCLMRIGLFNAELGCSEVILGEITQDITKIAESSLTPEERAAKLEQLADNEIRLVHEQEQLEQEQAEMFGICLSPDMIQKEIDDAASFWLSPASLIRLVLEYLKKICGDQEVLLGNGSLKTLRLSAEARSRLLEDFQKLPPQKTPIYRDWELWLKGGDPHLSVTFEDDCASQNPRAAFIMPVHPLVRQAAAAVANEKKAVVRLEATSAEVPEGTYGFAVYQWRYRGIRDDQELKPIAEDPAVTERLAELLQTASDCTDLNALVLSDELMDRLERWHHALWLEAQQKHKHRTQELAEARRKNLTTSHKARLAILQTQMENSSHEKIVRMRTVQIARAEEEYARRLQSFDLAVERADIETQPVAHGFIRIRKG